MTAKCFPPIRGIAMRATRLDAAGVPVVGACSVVTTDGFISLAASPQYDAGTETAIRNAAGRLCIYEPAVETLTRWDLVLTLCGVNPDILEMLADYPVLLDNTGDSVGNSYTEDRDPDQSTALEIWTDIASLEGAGDGIVRYGYLLIPWSRNWRVTSDITVQNDAVNAALSGSTKRGSPWGTGPHDVQLSDDVVPVAGPLLEPVGATEHLRLFLTEVPPPTIPAECGCTALAA